MTDLRQVRRSYRRGWIPVTCPHLEVRTDQTDPFPGGLKRGQKVWCGWELVAERRRRCWLVLLYFSICSLPIYACTVKMVFVNCISRITDSLLWHVPWGSTIHAMKRYLSFFMWGVSLCAKHKDSSDPSCGAACWPCFRSVRTGWTVFLVLVTGAASWQRSWQSFAKVKSV